VCGCVPVGRRLRWQQSVGIVIIQLSDVMMICSDVEPTPSHVLRPATTYLVVCQAVLVVVGVIVVVVLAVTAG